MAAALDAAWVALPLWFRGGFGFAFGAATGWFLAVVVERVPRGIGISGLGDSPRSQCVCGRALAPWENLPIVSYLALRGRARCCGATIPSWYLATEVGMGLWWAATWALPWLLASLAASLGGALGFVIVGLRRARAAAGQDPQS